MPCWVVLVAASRQGLLYRVADRQLHPVHDTPSPLLELVYCMTVLSTGHLCVGHEGGDVSILSINYDGELHLEATIPTGHQHMFVVSEVEGGLLAVGDSTGAVHLYGQWGGWPHLRTLSNSGLTQILCLTHSGDGRLAATGSRGHIAVWDLWRGGEDTPPPLTKMPMPPNAPIQDMQPYPPSPGTIALAAWKGKPSHILLDTANGEITPVGPYSAHASAVAILPDGRLGGTRTKDGDGLILDPNHPSARPLTLQGAVRVNPPSTLTVALSLPERCLLTTTDNCLTKVWDTDTGECVADHTDICGVSAPIYMGAVLVPVTLQSIGSRLSRCSDFARAAASRPTPQPPSWLQSAVQWMGGARPAASRVPPAPRPEYVAALQALSATPRMRRHPLVLFRAAMRRQR